MTTTKIQAATKSGSRRKQQLFFALTILSPFIFAGLMEGMFRWTDYGSDLALFNSEVINGKTYLSMNPEVKGRYFSRVDFSPNISYDYFQMPKPDTTFRIFCLGGSTTAGFPYSFAGSFSSFMRDRLRVLFPDKKTEVINLGITATNSYTVLDIARELVDYEPDAIVVYDGHNEFYGALGTSSRESLGNRRWVTNIYLRLIRFRSFQFLRNMYLHLTSSQDSDVKQQSGTMMERLARGQYVAWRSESYNTCLENFKANVEELADLCREHNIPLLLGGQVSNLRDIPPFVSAEDGTPPSPEFTSMFEHGNRLFTEHRYGEALRSFQRALQIDSLRADVHYSIAQCLDTLGRKQEAFASYVRARDYDMLRFRMSSDFNNFLRSIDDDLQKRTPKLITFVDLERKFKANSPDSLIGNLLLLEHLHPNARGYFLMAKEYIWKMHWRKLIVHTDDDWNRRVDLDEEKLWSNRAITEVDERAAQRRTEFLKSGWPFQKETQPISEVDSKDTLGVIVEQYVRGIINWEQAHVAAADHFARRKEIDKLEREYKSLVNQIPLNVSAYLILAQVYLQQQKNLEAADILIRSLEVERSVFAYKTLGALALEPNVAIGFFENAFLLSSSQRDKTETGYLLSQAYLRAGEMQKAAAQLQSVLSINPQFTPAQELLSRIISSRR